ncbi:hypothetical protein Fmac_017987 [Flemingia macrophylla]|uniref:PPM-type phosphatase domain-containing protein n=1 Tax=Flemingia macrophylla TaxID=520843 RepID=A0ABD1M3U7_9FABA
MVYESFVIISNQFTKLTTIIGVHLSNTASQKLIVPFKKKENYNYHKSVLHLDLFHLLQHISQGRAGVEKMHPNLLGIKVLTIYGTTNLDLDVLNVPGKRRKRSTISLLEENPSTDVKDNSYIILHAPSACVAFHVTSLSLTATLPVLSGLTLLAVLDHGSPSTSAKSSGTTVTFMIIEGWVVTVASVGDSRCILESFEGGIYYLSADHRLESNEEEEVVDLFLIFPGRPRTSKSKRSCRSLSYLSRDTKNVQIKNYIKNKNVKGNFQQVQQSPPFGFDVPNLVLSFPCCFRSFYTLVSQDIRATILPHHGFPRLEVHLHAQQKTTTKQNRECENISLSWRSLQSCMWMYEDAPVAAAPTAAMPAAAELVAVTAATVLAAAMSVVVAPNTREKEPDFGLLCVPIALCKQ